MIATYSLRPQAAKLGSLVDQISALTAKGIEVVVVSSGAIVLGMEELKETKRPTELASLQARAAIGQAVLMNTYSKLFKKNDTSCAQVLLTWDDFDNRQRYNNARGTLNAILEKKVVPVINENDTISTDEIKFGDNDRLAAFVAWSPKLEGSSTFSIFASHRNAGNPSSVKFPARASAISGNPCSSRSSSRRTSSARASRVAVVIILP